MVYIHSSRECDALKITPTVLLSYTIVFGIFCCMFLILTKPTVTLLMDARYFKSFRIVGFAAIGQFFWAFWGILLPGVYYAKETYLVSLAQGVSAGVVLVLNLFLIPRLGMDGAGLAFCLGNVAMVML